MVYRDNKDCGSRLTFGVELEFTVAFLPESIADPHPDGEKRSIEIGKPLKDFVALPRPPPGGKVQPSRKQRYQLRDWEPDRDYNERDDPSLDLMNYSKEGPHIRHRIAKFLRENGIPAISDSADDETEKELQDHWRNNADRLGFTNKNDLPSTWEESTIWVVDTDTSVGESINEEYDWSPVEIKSPILYYDDCSVDLVKHIVNLLVSEFRIVMNNTAMLHVHVGRGSKGYSLNNLRMIASLLYAAAPRIDQLLPVFCGPLTEWAPGIRTHSLMANLDEEDAMKALKYQREPLPGDAFMTQPAKADWNDLSVSLDPYHTDPSPWHMPNHPLLRQWKGHQRAAVFGVNRIWQASDKEELYANVGMVYQDPYSFLRPYRGSYNFDNCLLPDMKKGTVEFRQHPGTMSATAIEHWIQVTAGIVNFCVHADFLDVIAPVLRQLEQPDPNSEKSFLMNEPLAKEKKINVTNTLHAMEDDGYSVYDFLWAIGLGAQAEWYEQQGLHPMPPDFVRIPGNNSKSVRIPENVRVNGGFEGSGASPSPEAGSPEAFDNKRKT
ncbi:hypothetical protein JX266_001595 [Neoarthrinium moseri]|nr:hypothetical protein JX266_001595 [Neoarthrinium moseri]